MHRFLSLLLGVLLVNSAQAQNLNRMVSVPQGFEVTLFADDDLAHDIYSMTVDSLGRVVVSGRGYVKILEDKNGDGRADSAKLFANGPRTGAQGMHFDGRDLICVGDGGLIRYRDSDGDDQADGSPQTLLPVRAGGEHHAHAIRRGPDGYWYLVAGNFGGVTAKTVNHPHSPIAKPQFGTLVRLSPDFSKREVIADGYRNSYDFAFHPQGDIFVYDSDGERDVSLPWYRPTRVFQAIPGANAGWFARSWKRPNHYFEMQPVIGEFGRGSPTGVACYRHRQIPHRYRNAVFALDWTYGRVLVLPLTLDGSIWKSNSSVFMQGKGNFGFAPTDIAVGPGGEIFVSVGGRGTRGGVFRIVYRGSVEVPLLRTAVERCLSQPQPLSSWSRRRWLPQARKLGSAPFQQAIFDKKISTDLRVRAVEVVTELFGGIDAARLSRVGLIGPAAVRARVAWSIGRNQRFGATEASALRELLRDAAPLVQRFALQALIGKPQRVARVVQAKSLARLLASPHRFVQVQAARVAWSLPLNAQRALELALRKRPLAQLRWHLGARMAGKRRMPASRLTDMQIGLKIAADQNHLLVNRLAGTRLVQLALGDVGPGTDGEKDGPVFLGYGKGEDTSRWPPAVRAGLQQLQFLSAPTGNVSLDRELTRIIAMAQPVNRDDHVKAILDQISDKSHPVADIHNLTVLARLATGGTERRPAIAKALVELEDKITARKLFQDRNWEPRVKEVFRQLLKADTELAKAMVQDKSFGHPGHLMFMNAFAKPERQQGVTKLVARIRRLGEDYVWSNGIIFELARADRRRYLPLIREQFDNFSVRNAVLQVLAREPLEEDRSRFVAGLGAAQPRVVERCAKSLARLAPSKFTGETLAVLLSGLRRLGRERNEIAARDEIVRLLRRETKQRFGYQFRQPGPQAPVVARWTKWMSDKFPKSVATVLGAVGNEHKAFHNKLKSIPWNQGDAARGKRLYIRRSCQQCHGGRRSLGPDLRGVARRFNRRDLFTAIRFPSQDVSPRYQTTSMQLSNGKTLTGLVIYESIDGLILRNGANETFRIEARDIELRQKLRNSLMPAGLLQGLKPQDWADLYAYLKGL